MNYYYCYVEIEKHFRIIFGRMMANSKQELRDIINEKMQLSYRISDKKYRIVILTELECFVEGKGMLWQ